MAFIISPPQALSRPPRAATRITPPTHPPAVPSRRRLRTRPIPPPPQRESQSVTTPLDLLTLTSPPPLPSAPPRKRPQHARKPHGYWNDLSNLERELHLINLQLGVTNRRTMPRISEMSRLGRCDLLAALNKHGGLKKVAIALQWTRRSTRRKRESSAAATPASGGRVKVKRRAKYYWSDIERVKSEIGAFVDEFGIKGIMPTQRQFYMFGRSDLVNAAAKHGGLGRLSELMGFQCRRVPKGRLYWRQFSRLKLQLLSFSKANCPGYMPTGDELCKKGGSDIVNAIAAHGGFPHVANLCGLRRRNLHAQGAPVVWHVERLRGELLAFVVKNYPHRAREGVLPTERELRKCGRNDLSYAVKKFGGFRNVARIVGLKVRDKGPFQSANVSSSVTHSPVCGRDIADE